MNIDEARKLHTGDEVFWTDPDEGACSRIYTIQTIEVFDEIVVIMDKDGSVLECFPSELS